MKKQQQTKVSSNLLSFNLLEKARVIHQIHTKILEFADRFRILGHMQIARFIYIDKLLYALTPASLGSDRYKPRNIKLFTDSLRSYLKFDSKGFIDISTFQNTGLLLL